LRRPFFVLVIQNRTTNLQSPLFLQNHCQRQAAVLRAESVISTIDPSTTGRCCTFLQCHDTIQTVTGSALPRQKTFTITIGTFHAFCCECHTTCLLMTGSGRTLQALYRTANVSTDPSKALKYSWQKGKKCGCEAHDKS